MYIRLDGRQEELSKAQYFGAMENRPHVVQESCIEDLYQFPDGRWVLHTLYTVASKESTARVLTDQEAVEWLLELKLSRKSKGQGGLVSPPD